MQLKESDLRQLRGVGEVLAERFKAAGLDSFAKVAAAGVEGLAKVKGINPRAIPDILKQAAELASGGRAERLGELRGTARLLKTELQELAVSIKDRFKKELSGKTGKRLGKELLQVVDALEQVEAKMESRAKKSGKGLAKAEKRLAGLADGGFRQLRKGLKKARKSLQKVYA